MEKRFFTIFAAFVMFGTAITASAAPKSAAMALDTVRTTYDDGRISRIYTVKRGPTCARGWRFRTIRTENWR